MKKVLITLMLVAALALSAMAYNAPLTAAEFESGASESHATDEDLYANGNLEIIKADSALLAIADDNNNVYYIDGRNTEPLNIPADSFDVVASFASGKTPDAVAGYVLTVFFNPEIIKTVPLRNFTVYSGLYASNGTTTTGFNSDNVLMLDIQTDSKAAFANYLTATDPTEKARLLDAYNNSYKDGSTTAVAAGASDYAWNATANKELARWAFTETDSTNNNWYRTKIKLDVGPTDMATTNKYYLAPVIDAPLYYVNEDYTGPKFDIVGGMKRADGELRFGSVYFTGDDYYDNQAEIIEAGVVCYPTLLLEDKVLTLETEGAIKIPATGYYDNTNPDELIYTGVLTGLENAGDMYITAKSYIIYKDATGQTVTVYSDPIARNLNTADTDEMK